MGVEYTKCRRSHSTGASAAIPVANKVKQSISSGHFKLLAGLVPDRSGGALTTFCASKKSLQAILSPSEVFYSISSMG